MERYSREQLIKILRRELLCVYTHYTFSSDEFKEKENSIYNLVRSNDTNLCICEYVNKKYNMYYLNNLNIINILLKRKNHIFTILIISSILMEQQRYNILNVLKNNETIAELYICGGYEKYINTDSARIICEILDLQQLRLMDLSDNKLGPELGNIILPGMTINYSLTNMNLSNNGLGKSVKIIAEALSSILTLTTLNLSKNNLGPEEGILIAEGLGLNDSLDTLDISNNNLGEQGGIAISTAFEKNTTLTELNISNNGLGYTGLGKFLFMLCELKSTCKLTELDISMNEFIDNNKNSIHGLLLATVIRVNTSLKTLVFSYNMLGNKKDIGLAIANALGKNTTLTKLDLKVNKLGNENVLQIAQNKNTTLTNIDLSLN